jgi:HSP20 family molecular chaperone IbpA
LNVPISGDAVKATMKNGILEVVLPKAETASTKKINIESVD